MIAKKQTAHRTLRISLSRWSMSASFVSAELSRSEEETTNGVREDVLQSRFLQPDSFADFVRNLTPPDKRKIESALQNTTKHTESHQCFTPFRTLGRSVCAMLSA